VKREKEGHINMDPVATAIIAALSAGAVGGLTEASKTAVSDAYNALTALLHKKFGDKSEVVQAVAQLEAKPESANRQGMLQEEFVTVHAEHDQELLAAAQRVLTLIQPQQAGMGKFTIQNNAPVQGQNVGDHNTTTQYIGEPPKASS